MTPQTLLAHLDSGAPWPPQPDAQRPTDLAQAYRDALAVRALRVARGEKPVGFKIGFTNRTIWQRYRVFAPIWGTVWNTTLHFCEGRGAMPLRALCQPRLEPEIVFGIRATPPLEPSIEQLFDCVEWLAPGFEIVQSHCADWVFTTAQAVADSGLHGRLLVGPKTPVRDLAGSGEALDTILAASRVRLLRGGAPIDEGVGGDVLDGPLHALRHFVLELQQCPGAPQLREGDVVTTGTWTDAWPLSAGEVWRAEFDTPLRSIEIALP
ncbi:MAG TPA: hydratase [Burkholderiaceae bacterium]|nr:hydratase [Burkholderiaceae bacterium]